MSLMVTPLTHMSVLYSPSLLSVPNTADSADYHSLTFGDMTKGFGKQHQSKVPDKLVKDLRVRMPG